MLRVAREQLVQVRQRFAMTSEALQQQRVGQSRQAQVRRAGEAVGEHRFGLRQQPLPRQHLAEQMQRRRRAGFGAQQGAQRLARLRESSRGKVRRGFPQARIGQHGRQHAVVGRLGLGDVAGMANWMSPSSRQAAAMSGFSASAALSGPTACRVSPAAKRRCARSSSARQSLSEGGAWPVMPPRS